LVIGAAPGVATPVTIFVSPGLQIDTYYKYGPEPQDPLTPEDETLPHWYQFLDDGATGAKLFDDDGDEVMELTDSDGRTSRIELHFIDGARGDDDLKVNGLIFEPGGPALIGLPPQVEGVAINDGAAQRSMVTSLTVEFSGLVSIEPGAFELRRQGQALPLGLLVALSDVDGRTVATLTFTGPPFLGGSLRDGTYRLMIRGDKVRDANGIVLDGDGDGVAGGDASAEFFRLFGDSDGDGDVDWRDAAALATTLGKRSRDAGYLWYFDFNSNGHVSVEDLARFVLGLVRK
jgi:hypothetical protein